MELKLHSGAALEGQSILWESFGLFDHGGK